MEKEEAKIEIRERKDRPDCRTANGFLYCYCGKCQPEDYVLPEDILVNQQIDKLKLTQIPMFMSKEKDYYAKLVIYGLPTMKAKEKRRLLSWLEASFEEIQKMEVSDQQGFAKVYTK